MSLKFANQPNTSGKFIVPETQQFFGGRFVPEVLVPALDELTEAYLAAKEDPEFSYTTKANTE